MTASSTSRTSTGLTWEFNVAGAPVLVTGVRGLGPVGFNDPLAVNAVRGPRLRLPAACRLRCVAPPRGAAPARHRRAHRRANTRHP
jgi:hypothetical protein